MILEEALSYALEKNSFNKVNLVTSAKNVCVFGLGTFFREAFVSKRVKERYGVNLLCDNDEDKWGKEFEGILCVPPSKLSDYEDLVVIIMMGNPLAVQEQLDKMNIVWVTHGSLSIDDTLGMSKDRKWFSGEISKIKEVYTMFDDEESRKIYVNALCNRIAYPFAELSWKDMYQEGEYFEAPFMSLSNDEVYVDCGAYNGDTVLHFLERVQQYEEIHAFELDKKNFEEMEKVLRGIERCFLYNAGVWSEKKTLVYGYGSGNNEPQGGVSILKAGDGGEYLANVVKLDDIFEGKRVTLIKMDIEGAEKEALLGAQQLIKEQHPKMAICVYHKTSDFWEIPLLIKQLVPEYRFGLRHHCFVECLETVLYVY